MMHNQRFGGGNRPTVANSYHRMRSEVFNRMRAVDNALEDSEEDEDSEKEEENADLSDDFSSDEELDMVDYDNDITQGLWIPTEPKLFVIYNGKKFVCYDDE